MMKMLLLAEPHDLLIACKVTNNSKVKAVVHPIAMPNTLNLFRVVIFGVIYC